jgi:serine/threonine protein kinase
MMLFREDYNDLMEDLLFKLLNLDAEKRISVDEAINHPFFDSVRKEHFSMAKKK